MGAESAKTSAKNRTGDRTCKPYCSAPASQLGRSSERVGKSSLALRYQRHTEGGLQAAIEEYLALGARGAPTDWRGRTAGPLQGPGSQDSSGCYWARMKDDSGELDSIIANDNVNPGARVSITVKRGEFFNSNGCGTWTMV